MDLGKIFIFLILILYLPVMFIPAVSATEIRDLSGTWQIIDPAGQYSGSAAVHGQQGSAEINTYYWIIPITYHEEFTVAQIDDYSFRLSTRYGKTTLHYLKDQDLLYVTWSNVYAVRV